MKRLIVAILALIYLTTAIGTTVNLHYCMGRLADYSLWGNQSNTCSLCGMETSDSQESGCCKDERKHLKLDGDQKLAENFFSWNFPTAVALMPSFFSLHEPVAFLSTPEQFAVSHAPPLKGKTPAYLRFCVFRI